MISSGRGEVNKVAASTCGEQMASDGVDGLNSPHRVLVHDEISLKQPVTIT